MGFKEDFYGILDAHKDDRGWATSLSQRADVSQDALSKIINRKTKAPSIDTIAPIVDALGMCLSYGKSVDCSDIAEKLVEADKTIRRQDVELIGLRANVALLEKKLDKYMISTGEPQSEHQKSCA